MFGYFIKGKPQSFKFRFIDFSIFKNFIAGCKQLVAGKAHNLEVAGSSPAPARICPNNTWCQKSADLYLVRAS